MVECLPGDLMVVGSILGDGSCWVGEGQHSLGNPSNTIWFIIT